MKKILTSTVVCLALLAACKNSDNTTGTTTTTTTATTASTANPKTLTRAEANTKMSGLWMSEAYLQEVKAKRSVVAATEPSPILGFSLRPEELNADKDVKLYGFGTHEGGMDAPLKWDEAKGVFVHDMSQYKPDDFNPFSTVFELKYREEGKIDMTQDGKTNTFVRAKDITEAINEVLLQGEYTDSKVNTISLGADSKCSGFNNFSTYSVQTDFFPNLNFDAIAFNSGGEYEDQKLYHYKFKDAKTVEIFEVVQTADEEYEIGDLIETWTKK
jgi:hypothetical protein